ncbi:MAG: hypothetical protein Q7S05_02260 [bacterium]|nr:hypothetical protein [bacterium]
MAKEKKESEFDKLARLIKSEGEDIRGQITTDIAGVRRDMATKEDIVSIHRVMATKDDLKNFATKDDVRAIVDGVVEKAKREILDVVRPLAKAVDKDAVTVVNHEKRIIKIERHLAIK